MLKFFFSSRRRHTRLTCDWSSDVCSSDLLVITDWEIGPYAPAAFLPGCREQPPQYACIQLGGGGKSRSEERRVGKECRCRRRSSYRRSSVAVGRSTLSRDSCRASRCLRRV